MLITRVADEGERWGEGGTGGGGAREHRDHEPSGEYQTANDLFELMVKNYSFEHNEADTLSTRDLVLLYKNIDLGTQLMSNANEFKRKRPNQYVETVIYNEDVDSESSEVSEIYSNEDLQSMFLINKERIDLLNNRPSLDSPVCHKYGDLQIQSSNLMVAYDKHFLFKDAIKEQLQSLSLMSNTIDAEEKVLPASLLDYICCKRLEDNYTFYMDNIILYVKHTIEQLKRISNGDYLTDRAKEKWKEVDFAQSVCENGLENTKVLAKSTSIPLHVERKVTGNKTAWDDIVHSEVDVRSLSKILEKRIVLEMPKLICGSYRLFSKRCADNLIISCKREKKAIVHEKKESRVDVYFQLKRSGSGHVISKISSIMIVQTAPINTETTGSDALPLPMKEENNHENNEDLSEHKIKVTEVEIDNKDSMATSYNHDSNESNVENEQKPEEDSVETNYPYSAENSLLNVRDSLQFTCNFEVNTHNVTPEICMSPDDLGLTMQMLDIQKSLPEENAEDGTLFTVSKRKSSIGMRIKSPYENRSYLLDEKKRKKLLEIREKREKKKLSMVESCKMTKHKYGRSNVLPQASSSVTKLSITNKSFYNSIYGTSPIIEGRQMKSRGRKLKKEVVLDIPSERFEDCSVITPNTDCRKYVNRSYYLDDAVTEMMCMKMNEDEIKRKYGDAFSGSTSAVSNDFSTNLNILSQLIMPSVTDFNITEKSSEPVENSVEEVSHSEGIRNDQTLQMYPTELNLIKNMTRKYSPKSNNRIDKDDSKKPICTVEFRQSIDKIYDLIKKNDKSNEINISITKSKCIHKCTNIEKINVVGNRESSILQASDSGTSVKHHLTSSSPSNFSFGKTKKQDAQKVKSSNLKKSDTPIAVVPKVIISAKHQNMLKNDIEKLRKDHRRFNDNSSIKIAENPLKAISQLLHDIDYVQKTRQKTEPKIIRKSETVSAESARANLQGKRHSRLEQLLIENEHVADKYSKTTTPREKKPKSISESSRITHQVNIEEKRGDKISKKKISDIIDEAKEARGEAVRGPSKLNSRISTLAQPKKSYVQAHSEEYLTKYGKNVLTDRLQRLAGVPVLEKNVNPTNPRVKPKRSGPEASSTVSVGQPQSPASPLERTRMRGPTNTSPEVMSNRCPATFEPSYKQNINETHDPVKKMVAVESYIKSHFGRSSLPPELRELHAVQKSRVPLIPLGVELESMASSPTVQESTALGIKLHHIINTMLNSEVQNIPEDDIESKGKITSDVATKDGELNRGTKDIATAFDDDNTVLTTIDSVSENILLEPPADSKNTEIVEKTDMNVQSFNSTVELKKLENALYRQMSTGTFQKRLRIKNLTLTPKHSIQRLLVLQAGDSLVVKSTLSTNLKITTSKSADISLLKAVPAVCNSHVDRTFSKIPMQVTTVGYSFPVTFQSMQRSSCSRMKTSNPTKSDTSEKKENDLSAKENVKSDKVSQYLKGRQSDTQFDLEWQANNIDRKAEVTPANDTGITYSKSEEYVKTISFNKADDNYSLNKMETNLNISGDKEIKKVTSVIRGEDNVCIETKSTKVEYTTSLDILVGLLNEIQKITTCQTQITNSFSAASDHDGKYESRPFIELDNILKEVVKTKTNSAQDVVSMTSLDKLRHLESNPSIYSYCLSNEDDQTRKKDTGISNITGVYTNRVSIYNPLICADKEVSADFPEQEYVHTFTDVPSQLLPITITRSTNMSTSFFGLISKPSTQSIFSFTEYQGFSPDVQFKCNKKIIDLPHEPTDADPSWHFVNVKQNKEFPENNEITQRVEEIAPEWVPAVKKHSVSRAVSQKTKKLRNEKQDIRRSSPDIDPIMKFKRDVLLMAYSVLVFSVFAALSFPEFMYRS